MPKIFTLLVALTLLSTATYNCGSKKPPKPVITDVEAQQEVKQLMVLYHDARPKFVIQLQKLEQAKCCARAEAIHKAAQKMKADADMSPEPSKDMDIVAMELAQAYKKCQEK